MILQWSVLRHGSTVYHLVHGLCWNCSFRGPFLQHNLAISFWGLLAVHYTKYFSYWEIWAVSSIKSVTRRALLACSPWSSLHKIITENIRKHSYSASWTEFSLKILSFLFPRQGQAWNSAWEMVICANLISLEYTEICYNAKFTYKNSNNFHVMMLQSIYMWSTENKAGNYLEWGGGILGMHMGVVTCP